MTPRRSTAFAVLGAIVLSLTGCEQNFPETGARAIVPVDHLEKQRLKLEQMTANIKDQAAPKVKRRH